ncbi:MAG: ECF transporter S component [bacterium]|nr:ECF transporter S component [bacterium]MDE0352757.1 ECF transporter S component [bacterium]MDE0376079.1 ECF transporter S component [bacterium]
MSAIKDGLRFKTAFTTTAWVLIPVAIGINLIGRFFTQTLNLPLFLDTIGTTMAAFLAGPWVAAVAGVLTNLVIGLTLEATSIPFGIVNAAIGIVAGVMAAHGFLRSTGKIIVMMLCLTAITIITAMPLVVLVFEGVSGSGVDAVTGFFAASGRNMVESVLGQQLLTTPGDKVLTVLLAFALIKGVPQRYRPPFGREVIPF